MHFMKDLAPTLPRRRLWGVIFALMVAAAIGLPSPSAWAAVTRTSTAPGLKSLPSVAFYYGRHLPINVLQAFDWVVVDGDAVLLLAARHMQSKGELRGNLVVATSMSNMGLEAALRSSGIRMMRAPVGDKYVLEMMRKHDAQLGGEQSGHILFPRLSTTGDGLLTALVVLDLVARAGRPLHAMLSGLKVFPQAIVNVRVREKRPFDQLAGVVSAIREAESELEGGGRVVVRYSGTEQLARVMIEAE
jgi:phosphomannomutase